MVEETKKISSGKGCPLVSLTASNHLVLVEDVAPPAGDKVAKRKSAQGWNDVKWLHACKCHEFQPASVSVFKVACVSSNASIRFVFLNQSHSKPVHSTKKVQIEKTTRLSASVHVLLSPSPIQRLICSALQHAECRVAVQFTFCRCFTIPCLCFLFIVISMASEKHLWQHGHWSLLVKPCQACAFIFMEFLHETKLFLETLKFYVMVLTLTWHTKLT